MIKPFISQIVYEAADAATVEEKVELLRRFDTPQLRGYLKMAIDKDLQWALPPGAPPFTPCEEVEVEHVLYTEFRRMYIFLKGGNPNLTPAKREVLFRTFLESLHAKDAEFFINVVKDRKLPFGLTEGIIRKAFPKL